MAVRGRVVSTLDADRWSVGVEAHPREPGHWRWVIRLNDEHLCDGGCYRSARRAQLVAAGSLRVRQAIHYGQPDLQAKE
jgi:hypothetical protein